MPGIGVRTAARILLEVGDGSAFASSAYLATYAGIAPVTHRSGSSIREHPARSGNRKLERALSLSAVAALHDPTSRAYYDRKHAEGKKLGRRVDPPGTASLRDRYDQPGRVRGAVHPGGRSRLTLCPLDGVNPTGSRGAHRRPRPGRGARDGPGDGGPSARPPVAAGRGLVAYGYTAGRQLRRAIDSLVTAARVP